MNFDATNISIFLMIFNVIVAVVLFFYAYYLFRLERKFRSQDRNFDEQAERIIEDANKKALQILTKSEYVSDALKKEVDDNFDALLANLKQESMTFYQDLKREYETSSKDFVQKLEKEGEEELDAFAKQISTEAMGSAVKFEKVMEDDYIRTHADLEALRNKRMVEMEAYRVQKTQELEQFKLAKQQEFEQKLRDRIGEIVKDLMPGYIPRESQERLVKDAMEKASAEINAQL